VVGLGTGLSQRAGATQLARGGDSCGFADFLCHPQPSFTGAYRFLCLHGGTGSEGKKQSVFLLVKIKHNLIGCHLQLTSKLSVLAMIGRIQLLQIVTFLVPAVSKVHDTKDSHGTLNLNCALIRIHDIQPIT